MTLPDDGAAGKQRRCCPQLAGFPHQPESVQAVLFWKLRRGATAETKAEGNYTSSAAAGRTARWWPTAMPYGSTL